MVRFKVIISAILLICFISCDEVPVEIPDLVAVESGKVVLVEDLTGVSCPNCPAGSQVVEAIKDTYKDNVVTVAIHGGFLSEPITKEGYESKYDFRNEAAAYLEQEYLTPWVAKPSAYFNRIKSDDSNLFGNITKEDWFQKVEELLEEEQTVELSIDHKYTPSTGLIDMTVHIDPLVNLSGSFSLSIMITGSHLIDSQKDAVEIIKDYEHNHFLLDMATSYQGDDFASQLIKGERISLTRNFTIEEDNGLWNPEHITIVAFISDTYENSKEVLQAAEESLLD